MYKAVGSMPEEKKVDEPTSEKLAESKKKVDEPKEEINKSANDEPTTISDKFPNNETAVDPELIKSGHQTSATGVDENKSLPDGDTLQDPAE